MKLMTIGAVTSAIISIVLITCTDAPATPLLASVWFFLALLCACGALELWALKHLNEKDQSDQNMH